MAAAHLAWYWMCARHCRRRYPAVSFRVKRLLPLPAPQGVLVLLNPQGGRDGLALMVDARMMACVQCFLDAVRLMS